MVKLQSLMQLLSTGSFPGAGISEMVSYLPGDFSSTGSLTQTFFTAWQPTSKRAQKQYLPGLFKAGARLLHRQSLLLTSTEQNNL